MVKVFALIPRRPDVSEEYFHEHWAGPHAELARRITTIRRYVQSHRMAAATRLQQAPYEGIAEVWFDDLETAAGMGEDPNYANYAHLDEPNFIDIDRLAFMMTAERVLREGPATAADDAVVKLMLLLRAAPASSPNALGSRLLAAGDAVASALRISWCLALPESYAEGAQPAYDAVGELTFADEHALAAAELEVASVLERDFSGEVDIAASASLSVRELRVIWPEELPAAVG